MCKVRLLVVGDSSCKNSIASSSVRDQCLFVGDDVKVACMAVSPTSTKHVDVTEYDLAVIDENSISVGCSKEVLGSGLPVLTFSDVTGNDRRSKTDTQRVVSSVVVSAVDRSRLRDHIDLTMKRISATRTMMAQMA